MPTAQALAPSLRTDDPDERRARHRAPHWLRAPAVDGERTDLLVRARGLRRPVEARVWSPAGTPPEAVLPLLVAHDGPEYDGQASLTGYSAAMIASGALPPHRVALLGPGDRDQWYSASAVYGRALCHDVVTALAGAVAVAGLPVGMGASLGALAMLQAQRRSPGTFAGLFLQSGSFFVPRFDRHESGFARYQRIVRFVRAVRREDDAPDPVAVTLTCGAEEENVHNNRLMAATLSAQGYDATLQEVPGGHDFTGWRDALHPHLTGLLGRLWRA